MAASLGDLQSHPNSRKEGFSPVVSRGALQYAHKTPGRCLFNCVPYCGALLHSIAFGVRLNCSTMLSHSGQYEVVFSLVIPSNLQIHNMRCERRLVHLSDSRAPGTSKNGTILSHNSLVIFPSSGQEQHRP